MKFPNGENNWRHWLHFQMFVVKFREWLRKQHGKSGSMQILSFIDDDHLNEINSNI